MGDLNNGASQFSSALAVPNSVPDDNNNGSVEEAAGSAHSMVRRSRGRPPGSKNKPKPQAVVEYDSANALRCEVFKVSTGTDVVAVIADIVRRRKIGVSILCASGAIAVARIRQPPGVASASLPVGVDVVRIAGEIVTLTGTCLPATETMPAGWLNLTVHVAAGQGRLAGGSVVGEMLAAGTVVIVAATFSSFSCEQLSAADVDETAAEQNTGRNYGGGVPAFDLASSFAQPFNLLLSGRQDPLGGPWDSPAPPRPPRPPHPFQS